MYIRHRHTWQSRINSVLRVFGLVIYRRYRYRRPDGYGIGLARHWPLRWQALMKTINEEDGRQ